MNSCFYTIETYPFRKITDDAIAAVKKFYPIPFHRFMIQDFHKEAGENFGRFALMLLEKYDRVIFYGTDQIMFEECPRLFEKYDIAAPWNNSDSINGGLVSMSSKEAVKDWMDHCIGVDPNSSQSILNTVCFGGKYNSVILDKEPPIYGIKYIQYYGEAEYTDKLMVNGIHHTIMHFAGGGFTDMEVPRIKYEMLKPSVQERIKELIA